MDIISKVSKIPGMIEPIEQKCLFDLVNEFNLLPNDQVVEFGSFFGKSTACLVEGLVKNKNRKPNNKVVAFDSFSCSSVGGFITHVNSFAKAGGTAHLLQESEGHLNFFPVFEHYLKNHITDGELMPVKAELQNSLPGEINQIALMHIDSPKFYEELKIIIERFFPLLRNGSIVIFQDFFYHWSGTLIAAVEAMRQMNILEYRFSAASSLVTKINNIADIETVGALDKILSDPSTVKQLIIDSIKVCNGIQCDRPNIFIPRLWLAAYQFMWEQKKPEEATNLLISFFASGGKLVQPVLDDYLEMMRQGFSTRLSYENDHKPGINTL